MKKNEEIKKQQNEEIKKHIELKNEETLKMIKEQI